MWYNTSHIEIIAVMGVFLYWTCQTGLTGYPAKDVSVIFDGDNVAQHLSDLFDGKPQTHSISADYQVSGKQIEILCSNFVDQ